MFFLFCSSIIFCFWDPCRFFFRCYSPLNEFLQGQNLLKNSTEDGPGEGVGRQTKQDPTHQAIRPHVRALPWASRSYDWLREKQLFTRFFWWEQCLHLFCWLRSRSAAAGLITTNCLSYSTTFRQSSRKHAVSAWALLQHCLNQNSVMSQHAQACSSRTWDSKCFGHLDLQNLVDCPTSAETVPFFGIHTTSSCC